ncbi:hypothetical protein EGI22_22125 [Lacihabitans sp. LS3-19]|nr:hypothetical protein [Lacihabitans sp. LS3-19]
MIFQLNKYIVSFPYIQYIITCLGFNISVINPYQTDNYFLPKKAFLFYQASESSILKSSLITKNDQVSYLQK